jgi:hypothetical protein
MHHAWERREIRTIFWLEKLNERDHLEDLGVDGKIILEWTDGNTVDVDWIHLAQNRGQWQAVVCTVMNIRAS